jgi:hypothetical protein
VVIGDKTAPFPSGFVKFFAEYARFRLQNLPCLTKNALLFSLKNHFRRKYSDEICGKQVFSQAKMADSSKDSKHKTRKICALCDGLPSPLPHLRISAYFPIRRTASRHFVRLTPST